MRHFKTGKEQEEATNEINSHEEREIIRLLSTHPSPLSDALTKSVLDYTIFQVETRIRKNLKTLKEPVSLETPVGEDDAECGPGPSL